MNGEEREVLQLEKTTRTQDTQFCCNDIFKTLLEPGLCEKKDQIKTFLTKSILESEKLPVQKFILDRAEGKANQDVDLMFVLPFL